MRLQLTVVSGGEGPDHAPVEVEVEAPDGSTAGALSTALAAELLGPPTDPGSRSPEHSLSIAGTLIDPAARLGTAPLVDGAALTLAARATAPVTPGAPGPPVTRTPVQLAVTHGPDAGRTVELTPGQHTIGRGAEATIRIDDGRLSRVHATLVVTADAITIADARSTNGTELDGAPLGLEPTGVLVGATIGVGDSLLRLRVDDDAPAAATARGDGTITVNRRLRLPGATPAQSVTVPGAPAAPSATRVPWVAMVLPLPVAAVLALFLGPTMLAFAVMSPLMMAGTVVGDRLGSKRRYAAEHAAYLRRLMEAEAELRDVCRAEAAARDDALPGADEVLRIASARTSRLWERRAEDPGALTVGVGVCSAAAAVRVIRASDAREAASPVLHRVPCSVSLAEAGVLGVCGERSAVVGVLRSVVGQLVTLHSPLDLELVLATRSARSDEDWSWLGRLPHVRSPDGAPRSGWLLGPFGDSGGSELAALASLVSDRLRGLAAGSTWTGPDTLLLLDEVAGLRGAPDLAVLLEHGPRVGISVVATAAERSQLPAESTTVLDLTARRRAELLRPEAPPLPLVVDRVGAWWADRLSRGLAPLRDSGPGAGATAPPRRVGLLEVLDPRDPRRADEQQDEWSGGDVARQWPTTPRTPSAPLGRSAGGDFVLDLAGDGPHVLVAGTTGAGKSELLRTLVAALAVRHRPEHLSMVLVDYKGGAAFRDLAALPHVAGLVTDLDDHLASRALVSLRAELKRREQSLADAGVSDFPAYQALPATGQPALARLVIVVDEFRALAEELPAFVEGVVSIASLGRSLGVHLVLATQRPGGVVTADIKANLNLRIGLRLRDRTDSVDVLDAPDAATIDPATPGRAVVRTGSGDLVAVQVAHPGATSPRARPDVLRVRRLPWGRAPEPWPSTAGPGDDVPSDLIRVVDAVQAAAAITGACAPTSPWLPALPARIGTEALPRTGAPRCFPVGLVDEPEQQRQVPLLVSLLEPQVWGFAGGPRSGRTTALLTFVGAATSACSADELHLYAVGSGSLSTVETLPHCGALLATDDLARLDRLVDRLSDAVATRRTRPATGDPALLLVVDDWDLLAERSADLDGGRLATRLLNLVSQGVGAGLTSALGGGRALLAGRAASVLGQRVVLRVDDPTELLLAGIPAGSVPVSQPPGRGLLADGHEVQVALPPSLSAGQMSLPDSRHRPLRVDALPDRVRADSLPRPSPAGGPVWVGLGGDELMPLGLDPEHDGSRWTVLGGRHSGVSTTLTTMATGLLGQGRAVCVVARRDGPWAGLSGRSRVTWCADPQRVAELLELRRRRPDVAVLVDDAHELVDTPVGSALRELAGSVDRDGGLVVVGAHEEALSLQYRGVAVEVARYGTGVLLGPTSGTAADLLSVRAPVDRTAPPGRGHLVRTGVAVPIQVASTTVR